LAGLWDGKNYQNMTEVLEIKNSLFSVNPTSRKDLDQAEIILISRVSGEGGGC